MEAPMDMHFTEKNHLLEELKYCVLFKFEPRAYTGIDSGK